VRSRKWQEAGEDCIMRSFVTCTLIIYYYGDQVKEDERDGNVARMEGINAYKNLVGEPEAKRRLGRRSYRREDNIKIDLREIGWEGVEWIHLAQDKYQWLNVLNAVMNLRVP